MNNKLDTSYYAETAYTEKQRNKQPKELSSSNYSKSEQDLRVTRLPDYIACNELLAKSGSTILYLYEFNDGGFEKEIGDTKVWEELHWDTWQNKKSLWRNIKKALIFLSIAAFLSILVGLYKVFDRMMNEPEVFLVFLIPICGVFIAGVVEKLSKHSSVVIFNRRTGMVTIPRKGLEPFVRPFAEFVPYSFKHAVLMGVNYHMYLAHREEEVGAKNLDGRKEEAAPLVDWALLVQFMDVSQPLPDIPLYEPFRQNDPTTIAYDKQTGRPKRYWRDIGLKESQDILIRAGGKLRSFRLTSNLKKVSFEDMQWPAIKRYENKSNFSIAT